MPLIAHAITARKAELAQPHAPRVCFDLHKHPFPFTQEGKQCSMKFRRFARRPFPDNSAADNLAPII
jgi:hypothetical protein